MFLHPGECKHLERFFKSILPHSTFVVGQFEKDLRIDKHHLKRKVFHSLEAKIRIAEVADLSENIRDSLNQNLNS